MIADVIGRDDEMTGIHTKLAERVASPRRRRRPGPLVVAATALATFLVVLTLLAAQLQSGHDPALGRGTPVAALTQGKDGSKVVTRTSGGASVAQPAGGAAAPASPVTTRTSGGSGSSGFGGRESEDD